MLHLNSLYPELYDICEVHDVTVQQCINSNWVLPFRRWLNTNNQDDWDHIISLIDQYDFSFDNDFISWKLDKSGIYTVKSMYTWLSQSDHGHSYKYTWKAKLHLKIKIFLWLLMQRSLLTRDNMKKKSEHLETFKLKDFNQV